MAGCPNNLTEATADHKKPELWCTVLQGYCQFQKGDSWKECPVHAAYPNGFKAKKSS